VFASQNGTRMHSQIIRWVSFGVGKHAILKLHCFVTRAKRVLKGNGAQNFKSRKSGYFGLKIILDPECVGEMWLF
jgi:hypothetical protein